MPIQISISKKDLKEYKTLLKKSDEELKDFFVNSEDSELNISLFKVLYNYRDREITLKEADALLDKEEARIYKLMNTSIIASNVEFTQHKNLLSVDFNDFIEFLSECSKAENSYIWFRFFCSNGTNKYRKYGIQIENILLNGHSNTIVKTFKDYSKEIPELFENFRIRNEEISNLGGDKFNNERGGIIHQTKVLFDFLNIMNPGNEKLYLFPSYDFKYNFSTVILSNNPSLRKNRDSNLLGRKEEFYYDQGGACCPPQ